MDRPLLNFVYSCLFHLIFARLVYFCLFLSILSFTSFCLSILLVASVINAIIKIHIFRFEVQNCKKFWEFLFLYSSSILFSPFRRLFLKDSSGYIRSFYVRSFPKEILLHLLPFWETDRICIQKSVSFFLVGKMQLQNNLQYFEFKMNVLQIVTFYLTFKC